MIKLSWPELDENEYNKDWENAVEWSYSQWVEDQTDKTKIIRTLFLHWYVYVEDMCKSLSDSQFLNRLKAISSMGKENLHNDIDFQWLYGYVSSINPELFGEEANYSRVELDGRQLIKTALIKEPKNIFLQMLEKGTGSLSKYTSWKKQNSKGLEEYSEANFSGSTLFDEYFAEIIKSRNGK